MANTILVNDSDKYFEPTAKDRCSYLCLVTTELDPGALKQTLSLKIEGLVLRIARGKMRKLNEKEEQEKAPSKKLKEKIHACISSFQKIGTAVKEALEQGRKEGFADKEVGKMIREEMLRAGLTRQTVNNYLPKSAKAKPRGNPSGRPLETKFSKNFLLNEMVVRPECTAARDDSRRRRYPRKR